MQTQKIVVRNFAWIFLPLFSLSASAAEPAATFPSPRPDPPAGAFKNSVGMEMIRIPAGKYQRGARDGETGGLGEKTRHWVEIRNGFSVSKFPVTQGVYQKVMGANPSSFCSTGRGSDKVRGMDTTDFPVERVRWFDAVEFCNKLSALENLRPYYKLTSSQRDGESIKSATVKILGGNGYRLLTEAEWEYVARSGTTTIFPWGDSLSSTQANFDGNYLYPYGGTAKGPYLERTSKVGSYPLNAWGLGDTAGNVHEWVWDWYGEKEYQKYARKTAVDPTGPSTGMARVIRGGGWLSWGGDCRSWARNALGPEYHKWELSRKSQ